MMIAVFWWVFIGGYSIGAVWAFSRLTGQLAWHFSSGYGNSPDSYSWFGALALGALLSCVWPLSLPVAWGIASAGHGRGFFYIPPRERDRLMKERIRELEREAGIR